MPEIVRSLIVILSIASVFFFYLKKNEIALGLAPKVLNTRIFVWYCVTVTAFVSNNFWILSTVVFLVLYFSAKRDPNPVAFTFFSLFTLPLFSEQVQGFEIINYFFELNYFRIISIAVMFPAYIKLIKKDDAAGFGKYLTDKFLAAFMLYSIVQLFSMSSFTNTLRTAFGFFLDIFLPYFIASRSLRTIEEFDDALKSFIIASSLIGLIAFFEFLKGWLLYSALPGALGIYWDGGGYLLRAGSVRGLATSGQAIVLGFIMAVAVGFYFYINKLFLNIKHRYVIGLVLLVGLISSLSRGPWVGAAVIYCVTLLLEPRIFIRLFRLLGLALLITIPLSFTPYGEKIIEYLPFIGSVDAKNIEFRESLLDNALAVIDRNLWFGSSTYMQADELQSLRSGGDGGIIDIVNSYIAITLSGGLLGLFIFLGYFITCGFAVFSAYRKFQIQSTAFNLGVSLLATLVGIVFMIYTVSSIYFIPIIYWAFGGVCVAYGALSSNISNRLSLPHKEILF